MISHYTGNLSCTLEPGHILVIGGKTIDGASKLDINFKNGKHQSASIPLHISVQFHDQIIIRNSMKEDLSWNTEERTENLDPNTSGNPLSAGDKFQFYILVCEKTFRIAILGKPYCTYEMRLPLTDIRTLEICEDLQQIDQVDHRSAFPSPYPRIQLYDPTCVFSNDTPKPFLPGHLMVITGIPYGNPKGRFTIRFCENWTNKQALHFNVRFEPDFVIVRNSMTNALTFDREERDGPSFPFMIDQQFKLAIAFSDNSFKFAVNGEPIPAFKYRSPNQLDILNCFKMTTSDGLYMEITSIDHMNLGGADCDGFESFSDPEIQIF